MTDKSVWAAYFLGALATLAWKWALAVYHGRKIGKTKKQITLEWFFEDSSANTASWITTIGGVWLLGSIYIEHVVEVTGLTDLPVIEPVAFVLGSCMEWTAPAIVKWIRAKLPSPD